MAWRGGRHIALALRPWSRIVTEAPPVKPNRDWLLAPME